jgi:hypothetical protein
VPGVTDQHHGAAPVGEPAVSACTLVTSGHGASITSSPGRRLGAHRWGHPVGGEYHRGPVRNGVQLIHKHRTGGLEISYHVHFVHDLLAYVNRTAPLVQQQLNDRDDPFGPGAERSRQGKQNGGPSRVTSWRFRESTSSVVAVSGGRAIAPSSAAAQAVELPACGQLVPGQGA